MKAIIIFISLLSLSVFNSFGQEAIAIIKFQEAEEAYNNNDFETTITKLDEVESILGGKNPRTLYLRILAQNQTLETSTPIDLVLRWKLTKNCKYYLNNYETKDVDEKYKNVYFISEHQKLTQKEISIIQRGVETKEAKAKYELAELFGDFYDSEGEYEYFKIAADLHYGPALVELAERKLYLGDTLEADKLFEDGYKLMKAYLNTDPNAMRQMARIHYFGKVGNPESKKTSMVWYKKAAEKGSLVSMNRLAQRYLDTEYDTAQAISWYKKAIDQGHINSAVRLGFLYEDTRNYTEALKTYQKIADRNISLGYYWMAEFYVKGLGVEKDYKKAEELYLKHAITGSSSAMVKLGDLYYGGPGIEKNLSKAMEWYLKAAKLGDAEAMDNVGYMYEKGQSVQINHPKAEEWYLKAAEKNYSYSCYKLAQAYTSYGLNYEKYAANSTLYLTKNEKKALQLYQQLANLGYKSALAQVGQYYLGGLEGIEMNEEKAKDYFKRSEKENAYSQACYNLGKHYANYASRDVNKSIDFFTKGANAGNVACMKELSTNYKIGSNGYPRSKALSQQWDQRYNMEMNKGSLMKVN